MNPRVWFKSISLENVRSFGTKQTIYFTENGKPDGKTARWNVILGDNGTGKTTVLKGLCMATGNYWNDSDALFFRRFSRESPQIECVADKDGGEVKLDKFWISYGAMRNGEYVHSANYSAGHKVKADLLLTAYGAARAATSLSPSLSQQQNNVQNLFIDGSPLLNPEQWLLNAELAAKQSDDKQNYYDRVKKSLEKLFEGEVIGIESKTNYYSTNVYFKTHYGEVRLHELSLGYKTLIAWMVDFAKGLFDRYPDSEDPLAEPAVCLVDEIDLHLHPKFQRTIIQFLTETFPNTQFIVTAHSPLIVQSAEDANIILLKREGDETRVVQGMEVHSWRIDQILSSDLFGGISTRPPETETKMQRRRALLLKDGRTEEEDKELAQLEEELGMLTASESEEALKALQLINKALPH
ncbi:AAA family ATPase [Spirosoma montaniterrae]|uniref:ATPase AAA-type core domain-containing protein n=1 Tax=Spirosoma montaniterrae TaxID=1178516 RepID=A0A1P9X3H7_9BACT|nr:AAA family ATPase [Spirosoma montaniterrae]AQG82182.1 hypothetical protein AWR27_24545 [Spirosoma montaniterrae]